MRKMSLFMRIAVRVVFFVILACVGYFTKNIWYFFLAMFAGFAYFAVLDLIETMLDKQEKNEDNIHMLLELLATDKNERESQSKKVIWRRCEACNQRFEKNFAFCPHCGLRVSTNEPNAPDE